MGVADLVGGLRIPSTNSSDTDYVSWARFERAS